MLNFALLAESEALFMEDGFNASFGRYDSPCTVLYSEIQVYTNESQDFDEVHFVRSTIKRVRPMSWVILRNTRTSA